MGYLIVRPIRLVPPTDRSPFTSGAGVTASVDLLTSDTNQGVRLINGTSGGQRGIDGSNSWPDADHCLVCSSIKAPGCWAMDSQSSASLVSSAIKIWRSTGVCCASRFSSRLRALEYTSL